MRCPVLTYAMALPGLPLTAPVSLATCLRARYATPSTDMHYHPTACTTHPTKSDTNTLPTPTLQPYSRSCPTLLGACLVPARSLSIWTRS
eukprot:252741-Rhodomonas_salina.1